MTVFHNDMVDPEILAILRRSDSTPRDVYVSFAETPGQYFVKYSPTKWTLNLDDFYVQSIAEIRGDSPEFESRLRRVLFGKNRSYILVFDDGYVAKLEGEAQDVNHPLHQVRRHVVFAQHGVSATNPSGAERVCIEGRLLDNSGGICIEFPR